MFLGFGFRAFGLGSGFKASGFGPGGCWRPSGLSVLCEAYKSNLEVPKIVGTFLGVHTIRTIVFRDLYWGTPILGKYHLGIVSRNLYTLAASLIRVPWLVSKPYCAV